MRKICRSKNSQIFFHKNDKADQIVKKTSFEIITQDQTQTKVNTQTITELVPIQTLEIDFIQTFEPEVLHIMET